MLAVRGFATVSVVDDDLHPPVVLRVAVVGLLLSSAVGVLGVPPIGLHLPTHDAGIMMPTCGATRSVAHAAVGDLLTSWQFNPLGAVLVVGAWGYVAREFVGRLTGRWLDLRLDITRGGRIVIALLVVALAVNQQFHANLLA